MGRRTTIVISSSDEEDKGRSSHSSHSRSNSKSRPSMARTNPRGPKKARLSCPRSSSCKESSAVDECSSSCFMKILRKALLGSRMCKHESGLGSSNQKELWIDKYQPHSLDELAVHKKKVEEVKAWFEGRLRAAKEEFHSHVLVITGQAGVGKSATIHVIASHLGARLCEWSTPTPTIWQEHVHNSNSGIIYTSKLDEFENFVERTRKYGLFPASNASDSKSSIILLIDDLPMTNGKVAYWRLKNCLHLLVQSTRIPTAILMTDNCKSDSIDDTARCFEELQLSLGSAGAYKVAFNPITVNSIKKTLSRICRQELCNVNAEVIDLIAKSSGGDIRHAITSLQYYCLKPHPMLSLSFSNHTPRSMKEKSDELNHLDGEFSLSCGRDDTVSLFHALGKFLHNKRETEVSIILDQDAFLVRERFTRLPLKMDAPEKVLCQAHVQARPVADFLHENVLDFLSEEAIDDAWDVASYLSDSDLLLATLRGMITRNFDAESLVQTAAASVAVRGVLFGNSHPLPSRWHAIRRPKLWQVEQSSSGNKYEILRQRFASCNGLGSADATVIATEYTPALKWLGYRASEDSVAQDEETEDDIDRMSLENREGKISDDEIEDW
ncbi:cell cycle checkpoint protein RAD17 isoform X2 [Malania oleifera]|uniref:cell cycle checkpoint protein RAD17 isoform X2 n=1 Tax=Malania oleifera TaxID=397392 RepID=UPI0025AE151E|nr:cell cycle checkpoint protein RAD17 isoform X2 [Malania oleifera]